MTRDRQSQTSRSSSRRKCLRQNVFLIMACILFSLIAMNTFCHSEERFDSMPMDDSASICGAHVPAIAIAIDALDSRFRNLGGTRHWFHLLERLIVNIGKFSDLQQDIAKMNADRQLTIHIIFNEKSDVDNLGPFGRMLFTSLSTGRGLYATERIVFGYSTVRSAVSRGVTRFPIEAHLFYSTFDVDLTREPDKMFIIGHQRPDSELGLTHQDRNVLGRNPKPICFELLSRVSLDVVEAKLEWFDSSFEQFELFRSMVYNTCAGSRNLSNEEVQSFPDTRAYHSQRKDNGRKSSEEKSAINIAAVDIGGMYESSKKNVSYRGRGESTRYIEHGDFDPRSNTSTPVTADGNSSHLLSRSVLSDDLNVGSGEMQRKIKRASLKNKAANENLKFSPILNICPVKPTKMLLYQRDASRRFVDLEASVSEFRATLGLNWSVEILSHSENMSPCAVINSVRTATVFVTPHGFQSVLLLFQPLSSVIVEVHPSYYLKQEVYGFVQAGFRQNFDIARSYIAEESIPTHWTMKYIKNALQMCGYMTHECMHSRVCRNIARRQDVLISRSLIKRTADFLSTHFILKCTN